MNAPPIVWTPGAGVAAPGELIGGKAANLARLVELGYRVPPFFTITSSAFLEAVQQQETRACLEQLAGASDSERRAELAANLKTSIAQCELPGRLRDEVKAALRTLGLDDHPVAVRSSALGEDSAEQSFAGIHDSFLFVHREDALCRAIRGVWASAFNERAISYRVKHDLPLDSIAVAVVVQQMIDAAQSGVMFTCNPGTNSVHQVVISSLYGVGEGLVGAGLPADTYTVAKDDIADIQSDIADKHAQLVPNAKRDGLEEQPVPPDLRGESSLNGAQLQSLATAGLQIERAYGRPQDIEFCFGQHGELILLQSRPVTNIQEYGPAAGHRLVWDNSNIIESYSGVTSPMTFSFIRRAYTIVYHCFAEVMGISPAKVRANQRTFENMLGLFRGRVYYNLRNWYRLIRLFPGYQLNAQFMESMMGLQEGLQLDDPPKPPGFWRRWFVELPSLVKLLGRSTLNFLRIRGIVSRFEANFSEHYNRWEALDLTQRRPYELMQLYYEMEDSLLWDWKAPIINDFYVMIYFGLLKRLCRKWCGDESGSLQNDLICGEGGVESAEPAKMLLRLAQQAQSLPELRELITTAPAIELPDLISADARFVDFQRQFDNYLKLYGFRCMDELKLEEYSLRDRPHLVYQVLRNYLLLDTPDALDVGAMELREQRLRRDGEAKVGQALGGLLALPKRLMFRAVLKRARLGMKNRENMRFARTRIYGLLREVLRALGGQLSEEGVLHDPEDVFYLTIDEVWDYVKGTAVTCDLRQLSRLRRAEFDRYRAADCQPPDSRFETYGMAYHNNLFKNHRSEAPRSDDGTLQGIGCSPGVVSGEVKVIADPRDDVRLAGEILVAERTDPGWVPLYPAVSGLLIERGSVLSHSAVVAREMGIPTIVGIQGLTGELTSGQHVTMDGASGVVELVDQPTAESNTD